MSKPCIPKSELISTSSFPGCTQYDNWSVTLEWASLCSCLGPICQVSLLLVGVVGVRSFYENTDKWKVKEFVFGPFKP